MTFDRALSQMQGILISQNPTFAKQIDKIGFEDRGGGTYGIDTKIGGGQINEGDDSFGDTYYEARVWNATYNQWKPVKYSTLNGAKAYIKSKLKGQ